MRVSTSLDPDQAGHFVRPGLGPNRSQRLSADDIRRQKVKVLYFKGLSGADPGFLDRWFKFTMRECSGSVVECLAQDRRAAGSSLTGVTALWSFSKTHLSLLSTGSTQVDPSLYN